MNRIAIANETINILQNGFYEYNGKKIDISNLHKNSVENSVLITPKQLSNLSIPVQKVSNTYITVENISTVKAILDYYYNDIRNIGVLNFASAKNPGGGFLNGANAQEESLAASGGLYYTLTAHPQYYEENRMFKSMIYTSYSIYSPDVVFFRDEKFNLLETPITASVLTMPAVNLGQVILKGEDVNLAKSKMKERMYDILKIFAKKDNKNLVLGAYGCGVFRNSPNDVAAWWKQLLDGDFKNVFESIKFAVLDNSKNQECINAFKKIFN